MTIETATYKKRLRTPRTGYANARSVLGGDFITPIDIMIAHKGIEYTNAQQTQFASTVPSEIALAWCQKNGYILVPGPHTPLSLLGIRELMPNSFYSGTGGWYVDHPFAKNDIVCTQWVAFKKVPVTGSLSQDLKKQRALLTRKEIVPNSAQALWSILMYGMVRRTYLFPHVYVRTASVNIHGTPVAIGGYGKGGVHVNGCWCEHGNRGLGIASIRLF